MNDPKKAVPSFLLERRRLKEELDEANRLLEGLTQAETKGKELEAEISFILESITDLENQISSTDERVQSLIDLADVARTKIILQLRYQRGMLWEDVAGCTGGTCDAARKTAYRFFQSLRDQGINID